MGITSSLASGEVESPISIFMNNYRDKEFTKQDLENPSVFDMDEIDEIVNSASTFHNRPEKRAIIAQCVDIIKANPNWTLTLKEIPTSSRFNFNIELRGNGNTYVFREGTCHNGVMGISMWTNDGEDPEMLFHHSSNIRPYFESKKVII